MSAPITNDNTQLVPRTDTCGRALEFDFPAVKIGVAEYEEGPTGCTVFFFPRGAIVDRQGRVVRGNLDRQTGQRHSTAERLERQISDTGGLGAPGNTTLTVLVTNRRAGPWCLRQLAKQVHASMARGIQPFHTVDDGDVLYAVTTSEVVETALGDTAMGVIASELAWDAILNCLD